MDETEIAHGDRRFQTTAWSQILALRNPRDERARDLLDGLIQLYWPAVYAYIRTRWRQRVEEAKDLTQAFFAHLLEQDVWSRLDPNRGSFRGYLKRSLRNFVANSARHEESRKPKGELYRLDGMGDMARLDPPADVTAPEAAFDRLWVQTVLSLAIERLEAVLAEGGREIQFEVFRRYCLEPLDLASCLSEPSTRGPTYREVAVDLGLSESNVRNHLHAARCTLRGLIRDLVRNYSSDEADVHRELAEIFS